VEAKWGVREHQTQETKGKEGSGDPAGREAKSGLASSGRGLDMSGEQGFFADAALEEGQASLPDIPYLSEGLPPFRMNDTILATPPMALPPFSPLYSQAGYDSDEATNANQFLKTLHSSLMGILA